MVVLDLGYIGVKSIGEMESIWLYNKLLYHHIELNENEYISHIS